MSILEKAEAHLRKYRRCKLAVASRYGRKGKETIHGILITRAETKTEVDDGEVIMQSKTVDFLLEVDDLKFGTEAPSEPQPGDLIEYNDVTYEVCSIGGGKPFAPHGRDDLSYRIHTRQT